MGASNVSNMFKEIRRVKNQQAIYYFFKAGATLTEMVNGIELLLKENVIVKDLNNHSSIPGERPLNILFMMTLNDLDAVLNTDFVANAMETIYGLIEQFSNETQRLTTVSFMPYPHAPSRRSSHETLDDVNEYIRNQNENVFESATYDPNTLLVRPAKAGKPGNVNIKNLKNGEIEFYHSANEHWRNQGGYHFSNSTLTKLSTDIRTFLGDDMKTGNTEPWDSYSLSLDIDLDETVPSIPEPIQARNTTLDIDLSSPNTQTASEVTVVATGITALTQRPTFAQKARARTNAQGNSKRGTNEQQDEISTEQQPKRHKRALSDSRELAKKKAEERMRARVEKMHKNTPDRDSSKTTWQTVQSGPSSQTLTSITNDIQTSSSWAGLDSSPKDS